MRFNTPQHHPTLDKAPMSNQERQTAYRQVVQALLECPQNDEERILAANPNLVDRGLVKALKDKTMMMMRRNSPELGATMQRLVNLAQKLERKLASVESETVELEQEDYIRFSFELFQIVARSKGDGAIVHQFLDEHRAYFNEHLLAIFPQSIEALIERSADTDRQIYIRSIAQMLAIDLKTYQRGDRSIYIQLAATCKQQSSSVSSQPDRPIDTKTETKIEAELEPTETEIQPELELTKPEAELEQVEIEPELSPEAETIPTNEDSQITTYFQLVQSLLECPLNEEDRLLTAHAELVDEGLVRALLTAVETLKELNNPDSAWTIEWLADFAEKLSQKLGLRSKISQQRDDEEYEVALLERTREKLPLEWAMTQMNRANVDRDRIEGDKRENLQEAIRGYKDALTILTPTSLPIDALTASRALGQIYFNQGEWQLAVDAYEIAMASVETSRDWEIDEQRRQEMLKDALSIYENAIQSAINLQNYPQAIQYTERIRSRQLVELMTRKDRSTPAAISPDLPRYLAKVETITYPNIQKLIHNPHTAILTCYTTNDDTHIFIIKQSGAPTLHTCKEEGWKKFQNWLQKTWINPSHDKNSNWADNLPRLLHDIAQRLELDTLIEQHLTDINELIIVPHLNLHQIPFAALPINPPQNEASVNPLLERVPAGIGSGSNPLQGGVPKGRGGYGIPATQSPSLLGDRFIIRSIPSCQILQHCQQRPPVTTAHIGTVEDADDSLLGARYEGEILAALYQIPPTNRLRGSSQATAANYRALLTRVNRLHSSHHAGSNLNNPLESALLLAKGEKITLGDLLMGEHYPHLDEVFLSACQTHVGRATLTEDIATLTTGFLCVGARSVQSTLWSVDDYASVIFNVMYHQERRKGTNRAISLRTAQSRLRNLSGAEFERDYYPHAIEYVTKNYPTIEPKLEEHLEQYCNVDKPFQSPFYWAAFITQGMA